MLDRLERELWMFQFMNQKIAIKFAVVVIAVVIIISFISIAYFNIVNNDKLMEDLNNTVIHAADYAELVYSDSLWNFSFPNIIKLNNATLNNKMFIAVNIYDEKQFIVGHKKIIDAAAYRIKKIQEPFQLSKENPDIKIISRKIKFEEKLIGRIELFYTDFFVQEAIRETSLQMTLSFLLISVLIIIVIFAVANRLVIKPILELASFSREIADTNNYSLRLERQQHRQDEFGNLYHDVTKMLEQISQKDKERKELYATLEKSENRYRSIFDILQNAIDREDYSFSISPESKDDDLAFSLNKIMKTLEDADFATKNQNWIKSGQTELNDRISGEQSIEDLCRKAINFIAEYIGVQVGTVYVKDVHNLDYKLVSTYAFKSRKGFANRFKKGEGLVGQTVLEKKSILFTEVPDDYIKIQSSLGNSIPKNILVLPLVFEEDVKGVIEIGSVTDFKPIQIEFMDLAGNILAVAINAALSNEQLKILLDRTKEQSEELKAQQEGLKAANEELEEQTQILKESEAKLQVQQEELQASNEEMEEKTELLEKQKKEIQKTNSSLMDRQKEIEEKARQLELATRYKSEFLSNMSHELRTPLNSLLLLSKMLADNEEQNLSEDQIESVTSIYRSGQNLLHLINDILDLSKIEARKIELNISAARIATLASNCKTEFFHVAKNKGIDFLIHIQEGLPDTILTDEHRLEQVLRNLLGNAFKFTETGSVSVDFFRPKEDVQLTRTDLDLKKSIAISVSDTGPGIPAEKVDLIFEAFKQVDGSISRRHGGTGLGLSISKELAYLIGGELRVESTFGKGAVFTVFLPENFRPGPEVESHQAIMLEKRQVPEKMAIPKPEKSILPKEPEAALYPNTKTMLIIEDDNEFARILANFFLKNGYESIIASNGETGIKYVIDHKPTGIILDIGLPGIDGWAVLNELKQNPETRHIPVHIMSAYDNISKGLQKGAVGYLTKPVKAEDLEVALGRIEGVLTSEVKELLIVEDDEQLRKSILKLMETNDIHATAIGSGKEALSLLKTRKFDCMILDLGLPDIPGFELLDIIETEQEIDKIPIIIFTGRDLTREETEKLERYSSSIVLKNAASLERLLDETALFMHRVERDMPEPQQEMIRSLREQESVISGKKVMIVDDDMRNAFALNKFLKSKGMQVCIADNGKKAIELLEKDEKPDIILMDIMMPVMDGYETMKQIRLKKKFTDIPILALTAKAMESDREECIRSGANDYLSKPVDVTKLLSMLRVWLY
ncbi:MAG: histidine kinase [Desulfobacterium sp.]|nr:histidine kinase [Desulfobacterium sp.]